MGFHWLKNYWKKVDYYPPKQLRTKQFKKSYLIQLSMQEDTAVKLDFSTIT